MIEINNLTFGYIEGQIIINSFSAKFNKSERVCICAPSGAGKTTLLRLITGLETPCSGFISIENKAKLGFVFQNDALLPWYTAKQNASVAGNSDKAVQLLYKFGLGDCLNKYPAQMSGGMNRRVAIVRAMTYDAEILLLDEAFKGIDKKMKSIIMNELIEEYKGRLIIFTAHEQSEIDAFATRIITL